MISQPPEELKIIRPFIQRGNQMARVDPIITYYCYYWSVRVALEKGLHSASPECAAFVSNLMEDLEGRKEALKGNDLLEDDMAAQAHVENFALKIFDNGSKAVEAGKATAKTPDTLQAAATFMEIIKIFTEELDPEIAKKIKYAKFHAARILKALKEGVDPNPPAQEAPPPPTLEEVPDESFSEEERLASMSLHNQTLHPAQTPDDASMTTPPPVPQHPNHPTSSSPPPTQQEQASPPELPSAPTHSGYFPPVPVVHEPEDIPHLAPSTMGGANTVFPDYEHAHRPPSPPMNLMPSAPSAVGPSQSTPSFTHQYQQGVNTHIPPPPAPSAPKTQVGDEDMKQAQKYAKWAISALDYEDVDNAILQLRRALGSLGVQ